MLAAFTNRNPDMSNRSIGLDADVYRYLLSVSLREDDLLAALRAETAELSQSNMQIAPEQGQFMALLAKLVGARRYLEVGTFTGYSTLAVARALGEDGETVACDISREWTDIARRYWREAGLGDNIRLELAPAADTLAALVGSGHAGAFDLAFIDADKTGYIDYYERCLDLVRPGGIVMLDNTLWDGDLADPANTDADTEALRAVNLHLKNDARIDLSLVPIGDGLSIARKR